MCYDVAEQIRAQNWTSEMNIYIHEFSEFVDSFQATTVGNIKELLK